MRVVGILKLFRTPSDSAVGPDGRMALADHLRELRARVLRSILVLAAAFVAALFFFDPLFSLVYEPYRQARELLEGRVETEAFIKGAAGPLLLRLKLAGITALIATSPYWLYQIWAFILPGLHAHERKWSRVFMAVAGPLFMLGVATGYYVLPRGLEVLIGFTADELRSLVEFGEYFSFFTRMLLVFGVAFMIPLFVIMLNLAGVVPGKKLGEYRAWIVLGTFVFAAAATPSTDPFSMLMLALPMTVLFLLSEVIARILDRRRARATPQWDDDEASELDERPSDLDEDDW
jgi:sec-independent protein translocase protein TatC